MGWWKIDSVERGQIVNAVPGRDSADAMYNGDGPADLMGSALRKIDAQYVAAWGRSAKAEELREVFDFCLNGMLRPRESGHANNPILNTKQRRRQTTSTTAPTRGAD